MRAKLKKKCYCCPHFKKLVPRACNWVYRRGTIVIRNYRPLHTEFVRHLVKDRHERWTSLCKEARKANFNCEDYSKLITFLSCDQTTFAHFSYTINRASNLPPVIDAAAAAAFRIIIPPALKPGKLVSSICTDILLYLYLKCILAH